MSALRGALMCQLLDTRYAPHRNRLMREFGLEANVVRFGGDNAGEPVVTAIANIGGAVFDSDGRTPAQYMFEIDLGGGVMLYCSDHRSYGLSQAARPPTRANWVWNTFTWQQRHASTASEAERARRRARREPRTNDGGFELLGIWRRQWRDGLPTPRTDVQGLAAAVRFTLEQPYLAAHHTPPSDTNDVAG